MKVLITGGAGFIGSHLSLKLLAEGHDVIVMDSLIEQVHGSDPSRTSPIYRSIIGKVDFIQGDVCNRNDWLKALSSAQVVVHLAAETGTGQSMHEILRYSNTNITGTAILLEILTNTKHSVKKVIIASSRSIYGEGKYRSKKYGSVYPKSRLLKDLSVGDFEAKIDTDEEVLELVATDEESMLHPSSIYGITKLTQEQMVMCACENAGIAAVSLRFQNVYGPGQSLSNPYTGILSIFSTLILQNKEINIFEDGKESRDFVYIDDVVKAIILSIENENANNQVFNVGTGIATSVLDVAKRLIDLYKSNIPLRISGDFRLGDIRHNYADIGKIQTFLGFRPSFSFDDGIRNFTDWVKELKRNN